MSDQHVIFKDFKSGLTKRSALSAIYATIIFIPAIMYLQLLTGQSFSVSWFMLLLWAELSAFFGSRLTKQEAFLIFFLAEIEWLPLTFIYNAWFRNAPIVQYFGLTTELPDWWFPPIGSEVYTLRTLLHQDWLVPFFITFVWLVLSTFLQISLGFLAREIFVEAENLPFPMAQVSAITIISITGEEKRPTRILSTFAIFGFVWGFFVYALPFILQAYTGRVFYFVPIPWFDMTRLIERVIPGACFGVATDFIPYATGLVMPLNAVIGMSMGSFAIYIIGNWMTVAYRLAPDVSPDISGYQSWWIPGMDISLVAQRSIMYFWFPITVGLAFAVGVGPMLHHPKTFFRAFSTLTKPFSSERTRLSDPAAPKVIFLMMISSLIGTTMVFVLLVPDFVLANPWILAFMLGFPFVTTIIKGRVLGEAGVTFTFHVAELQNVAYLASGAPINVWFAPNPTALSGNPWLNNFKLAQLTETKTDSVWKAYLLLLPFTLVIGLVYAELLWRVGPIPSDRFPGAQVFWPIQAINTCLWIKGVQTGLFNLMWVLYSLIAGIGLYAAINVIGLPISYAGFAAGAGVLPPYSLAFFVGGIVSKAIERKVGRESWRPISRLAAGGLMMGESIAITISVAISLIINSIWVLYK